MLLLDGDRDHVWLATGDPLGMGEDAPVKLGPSERDISLRIGFLDVEVTIREVRVHINVILRFGLIVEGECWYTRSFGRAAHVQ